MSWPQSEPEYAVSSVGFPLCNPSVRWQSTVPLRYLSWRVHIFKVIASATHWSQQLWRVARTTGGLSPSCTQQLYNTIAVPAFTYAFNIWYIPPFKWPHSQISCGSVLDTKSLQSIQGTAARYITGGICGTAYNVLEAHANLPPVDLLFCKVQLRAASRICTLPSRHPLHSIACCTAARFVQSHHSPLHYLFVTTGLNSKSTETIDPVHQHPNYKPGLKTTIEPNKDSALTKANGIHTTTCYKVCCDSSGFEGGAGALAVLYKDNHVMKSLHCYLGPLTEHMVYELELVGLLLALHLLLWLTCHLLISVIIGLNNQAAIHLLVNQESKPAHYLHQEIGETLVFPVRSDHVMDLWDFMFNTYKALASITRPASGLQGIVIIWNTDDIFYWITFL